MREVILRTVSSDDAGALNAAAGPEYRVDSDIHHFDPLSRLAEFESQFPNELALFKTVGIHPTAAQTVQNPYTGMSAADNFTNIGEHCLAVAHCAEKISGALVQAGLITVEDARWIVQRALVHDLSKPFEIMRRDAQRSGASIEVYSVSAYEKLKPILLASGVSDELAEYLVCAGKETGHNSLRDLIVAGPDGFAGLVTGRLAEKVVHLADDMTFTSIPKGGAKPITAFFTCWERMLASNFIEKYPFLWREGLAAESGGEIAAVGDVSNTAPGQRLLGHYAELQVLVANAIAREIQLLLSPECKMASENFVKLMVNAE